MLKNYVKIAWRNLQKSKGYAFINIGGLAIGMAVALLIGLWIWDELSFDSSYKQHKRLAQVMVVQTMQGETEAGESIAMPLADALRTGYASDFKYVSLSSSDDNYLLTVGDKKIKGTGRWVQHDFPEMFSLNMISGKKDALTDPSSVLLSKTLARSIFGDAGPLNRTIRINNEYVMKVAGVYEDMPRNSSFYESQLLLAWDNPQNWRNKQKDWTNHCGLMYVELTEQAAFETTGAKIKNVPTPHVDDWKEEAMLNPLDKAHLYNQFENGKAAGGRIQFVWLFGIIGTFVLLLACINFMNLATARSEKRAREVGIRKAIGSLRSQLVGQFLTESVLIAFMALVLAIGIVQLSLPFFNDLADKEMSITWSNPAFWVMTIGFTLFTGLISGSYPAFYLSAFQPIKVLKGMFRTGRFASMPRKVLVVVQFTVSITLIIGTIIVFQQVQHAKDRPVGYNRDGLISMPLASGFYGHYNAIRNDMLQTGVIVDMAESSQPATYFNNNNSIGWTGKDPGLTVFFRDVNVTYDFGKTIGWTIKEGRDFSRDFATDTAAAILNESAAKVIGLKDIVGQTITYNGDKQYRVVGIVKDMVTQSPYDKMEPSVFFCDSWMGLITARIKPGVPVGAALAKVETIFKKYNPEIPFEYRFLDDDYARKFSGEERIGNLATVFAVLAVFISCLGLFGLASFVAEQRTREIGVRKVLGASVFSLWKMLSKDFVTLVVIACVVAAPVSWYLLAEWLQNYQYHATISWWVFIATAFGAMMVTLFTVSFQAIKAALTNPVKSLRSE